MKHKHITEVVGYIPLMNYPTGLTLISDYNGIILLQDISGNVYLVDTTNAKLIKLGYLE